VGAQPGLTLRPLAAADADEYGVAAAEEPGEPAALSGAPEPFDATAEIRAWVEHRANEAFAVEEDGRLVAIVSLQPSDPGEAEGAYWVRRSERGRGLATAALRLLTEAAWDRGLDRVWLEIYPDNPASFRVAQKCGFADEGVREDGMAVYALRRPSPSGQPPP
jgi:ribosomal-protein-alanine N-acetyltransferase